MLYCFSLADISLCMDPEQVSGCVFVVLRARRNEKDLKVKPATSFKYFQYLLTKIKTKFKAEKI